jgi:Gluconate 2-dehydrogenase subunit 3
MAPMNRRDAVKTTTALLGGVLVGSSALVACGRAARAPGVLNGDDEALIEDIADTLLPPTPASPGAKDAGVGAAINLILTDCYKPDAQQRVVSGLSEFRSMCRVRCGAGFASLPRREREQLLREIDVEAQKSPATHYFALVRELSHGAYFSSQVGVTQALRYVPVPGRFDGCVPLTPGQPAWS